MSRGFATRRWPSVPRSMHEQARSGRDYAGEKLKKSTEKKEIETKRVGLQDFRIAFTVRLCSRRTK